MECFIAKFHNEQDNTTFARVFGVGSGEEKIARMYLANEVREMGGFTAHSPIYELWTLEMVLHSLTGCYSREYLDEEEAEANGWLLDLIDARGPGFLMARTETAAKANGEPIFSDGDGVFYAQGDICEFECAIAYIEGEGYTVEIFESIKEAIDSGCDFVLDALRNSGRRGWFRTALINAGVIEIN